MADVFRFGVTVPVAARGTAFLDAVAAIESSGADTVLVPDHLGMMSPTAAMLAAAMHAPRMRVGTFVLNTSFYVPALLARDLATVDRLTGGRLDIGLGAGFSAAEFADAGLEFPSAGQRVDHLLETVRQLREALADPARGSVQTPPPIIVGGNGDRVLAGAAREADAIALSMLPDDDALAGRVEHIRRHAGDRGSLPTVGVSIFALGIDREPDLTALRSARPDADDAALRRSVNVLTGSLDEVVARVLDLRARFGVTRITISQPSAGVLDDFARIIQRVRELQRDD